jgi:light-regulated signal transduction histidine kinase (bacteriophytochrome)
VTLVGDRALLRRLVRNLLENARRHAGGAEVELEVAKLGPGRARIRVSDRGPGVPESERERIFTVHRRAVSRGEGQLQSISRSCARSRATTAASAAGLARAAERSSKSIWGVAAV